MQTKRSSNYQELKKSICNNYLKGTCQYGRDCKYRHPPNQRDPMVALNSKKPGKDTDVCKYFLQGKCKRGAECPFAHTRPKPEVSKQPRSDWLTFCLYFPNGQCKNKDCRFLHITEDEKNVFRTTGKIKSQLLEQAMCKALLQEVAIDGTTLTCKDFLQGRCQWMSCPSLHLSRQEFSRAILDILYEKFETVLGSHKPHQSYSTKAPYNPSVKYQETVGYDALVGHEKYKNPSREKYTTSDPHKVGYGNKHAYRDGREDYEHQPFVSSETDRIVKGIYNLMKDDANLIRNAEKQEISDLRGKLDNLAEENARYRYEFSRLRPFEGGDSYGGPPMQNMWGKSEYEDMVRRLERENMEMKMQLSRFQEHEPQYWGNPEPSYGGRRPMEQFSSLRKGDPRRGRGGMRGQNYHMYDRRGGEDRRDYGYNTPLLGHAPPYNPLRQKVNNQLRQNMVHQYKKNQPYSKVNYQKYQKPLHQVSKKTNQQQPPKNQKLNPKANPKKKPGETQNPNQTKSVKPKNTSTSESDKDDDAPIVEDESSDEEIHFENEDKSESSQEVRINEGGTAETEGQSSTTQGDDITCKEDVTKEDTRDINDKVDDKTVLEVRKENEIEHKEEKEKRQKTSEGESEEKHEEKERKTSGESEEDQEKERKMGESGEKHKEKERKTLGESEEHEKENKISGKNEEKHVEKENKISEKNEEKHVEKERKTSRENEEKQGKNEEKLEKERKTSGETEEKHEEKERKTSGETEEKHEVKERKTSGENEGKHQEKERKTSERDKEDATIDRVQVKENGKSDKEENERD